MGDLPRSNLKLTLRLRELVIPVGLLAARDGVPNVKFKLVHIGCGEPLRSASSCPTHGAVPAEQVGRAWESGGELIPVDLEEVEALAPADSRGIDVFAIVQAEAIDPLLMVRAWYLIPERGRAAREGYAALEHALAAEQLTAVVRFVAWGAEHLAAIDGYGSTLVMRELASQSELRDPTPIADVIAAVELSGKTRDLARKLVARLEVPWEPELLTNLHRAQVQELLDAKLAGERIVKPAAAKPVDETSIFDVDQALARSLRGVPRGRKQRLAEALAR